MSQNNGVVCSFKAMNDKISKLEGLMGSGVVPLTMVEITYSELKSLRDNKQLTPGCWYRITDYETTTSQNNTQSAGHLFDVIVLALDNKTLSEDAAAIQSARDNELISILVSDEYNYERFLRSSEEDGDYNGEHYYAFKYSNSYVYTKSLEDGVTPSTVYAFCHGSGPMWLEGNVMLPISSSSVNTVLTIDSEGLYGEDLQVKGSCGYFGNSKLAAWQLKYCLDNDTNRFAWAKNDTELAITIKQSGPGGWRDPEHDIPELGLYAWRFSDRETYYAYTFAELPNVGDYTVFTTLNGESLTITSVTAESIQCSNEGLYSRDSSLDKNGYYGWRANESIEPYADPEIIFTKTESPVVGDEIIVVSYSNRIITDISWNGKGIIYRMIDEFGNDCPYDFKNIQHILPINEWVVDSGSGTDKPCYTFDEGSRDYSITGEAVNNVIGSYYDFGMYQLPIIRMAAGMGNRIGVNCNRIYLGAMNGANVCQFVTDVDYQTAGRDTYHQYEWFGRARNGSVVQTNIFGTAT